MLAEIDSSGVDMLEGLLKQGDYHSAMIALGGFDVFGGDDAIERNLWAEGATTQQIVRIKSITCCSELLFHYGRRAEAVRLLRPVYEIFSGDVALLPGGIPIRMRFQLAEFALATGQVIAAQRIASRLQEVCVTVDDPFGLGEYHYFMARLYQEVRQYELVEGQCESAEYQYSKLLHTEGNPSTEREVCWRLTQVEIEAAFSLRRMGRLTSAAAKLAMAWAFSPGHKDSLTQARHEQCLACLEATRDRDKYEEEVIRLLKVRNCYEQEGHQLYLLSVLVDIGNILLCVGEEAQAKSYLEKATRLLSEAKDPYQEIDIQLGLSRLYLSRPRPDLEQSELCAAYALRAARRLNCQWLIVDATLAFASCKVRAGAFKGCQQLLEPLIREKSCVSPLSLVHAHLVMAELLAHSCWTADGLDMASKHCDLAEEIIKGWHENDQPFFLFDLLKPVKAEVRQAGGGNYFVLTEEDALNEGKGIRELTNRLQKWAIVQAFKQTGHNKTQAAKMLGLSRPGLDKMLERLAGRKSPAGRRVRRRKQY